MTGTADRTAKLVLQAAGERAGCRKLAGSLGKGIARQVRVALPVIERRTVKFIRPGLGLNRHDGRNRLAKRSVKILRRDLRFRERVEVRIDDDDAQHGIFVIRTVQFIRDAAERLSIYLDLLAALGILIRRMGPAKLLCARQKEL